MSQPGNCQRNVVAEGHHLQVSSADTTPQCGSLCMADHMCICPMMQFASPHQHIFVITMTMNHTVKSQPLTKLADDDLLV